MADLLQEIEAQIAAAKTTAGKQNVGTIREIADGVAKVEGLADAMLNEMIDLGHGITGLALDLGETEVGVIILGDYTKLEEGDEVRATGKLLQVPVGKGLLGRVVNTLGEPLDGKGPVRSDVAYPVEKIAPGIIRRRPVSQPVQTGIMAIDAMIPIGRGQRQLIIGDRSTGKTTIGIDTIISQARLNKAAEAAGDKEYRPLYCIYVAIGQKQSTIARIIATLEQAGAMPYTIIVASPASDSATSQYLAPFAGTAMGEWFMDNGMDALIIFDDLSKHAVAYRQVSLVLKRPSGREAYPGDVFTSTADCSNGRHASEKSMATVRSQLCRSSKLRPATSPLTSPPTSSRSRTGRFSWKPTYFTKAPAPRFPSASPSPALAPRHSSRP